MLPQPSVARKTFTAFRASGLDEPLHWCDHFIHYRASDPFCWNVRPRMLIRPLLVSQFFELCEGKFVADFASTTSRRSAVSGVSVRECFILCKCKSAQFVWQEIPLNKNTTSSLTLRV